MSTFEHPQLGPISFAGEKDGLRYFRGIKYASLSHAFATAQLTSRGDGIDATRNGPAAISPPGACDMELGLIQHSLPHDNFSTSATDCLHLNLCAPVESKEALPVLVFMHGGGFQIGSNAWPQYDLARIVQLSQELSKPIIAININYRLGIYGFLDSDILRAAGAQANRGLHDQRTALRWVREYIAGFGGDPNRVTLAGESAGGVSATLQIQSKEPLFNQLISMSGTSLFMKPLPSLVASGVYMALLEKLGIDAKASPSEQLKFLMDTSPEKVLSSVDPGIPLFPVVDGEFITSGSTYADLQAQDVAEKLPGSKWCKRVMFGDCKHDGGILGFALLGRKGTLYSDFLGSLKRYLSPDEATLHPILEGYHITADATPAELMNNILSFVTDVQFYVPAVTMPKAWSGSSFVYHFNEPNTWPGPWQGQASHVLDVAYLFQNFNDFLSDDQRAIATKFAGDIIKFVHGDSPYPVNEYKRGGAQVYGGSIVAADGRKEGSVFVNVEDPSAYDRNTLVWQLTDAFGWEKLSFALDMFIAGK